jgi:uncharacterized protein YcfJ
MGVCEGRGVAESAAMNVLLRSVWIANVVSALPSMVGVREGVREAVAEGVEVCEDVVVAVNVVVVD